MHPAEIKVNNAISQCRDLLTDAEYFEAFEYSDQYGEYGLAIETLADILIEKWMTPSRDQLNAIAEAFRFTLMPTGVLSSSKVDERRAPNPSFKRDALERAP